MNTAETQDAISRISELPTLPQVLQQLMAALADPDASALELGRLIATDQSIAAALLRQVNSAYYGFYRQISSVPEAVVILGFRETRNLILTASVFRSLPFSRSGYDRARLWRHSLAAAMLSERIGRSLRFPTDPSCFSAGLLHDIGKVVLDHLYPERYMEAIATAAQSETPEHEIERAVFGIDHGDAGGILAGRWNLPVELTDAITSHHRTESGEKPERFVALAAVADHLAHLAGFGESPTELPPPYPINAMESLALDETLWRPMVEDLSGSKDRVDALLLATAA